MALPNFFAIWRMLKSIRVSQAGFAVMYMSRAAVSTLVYENGHFAPQVRRV